MFFLQNITIIRIQKPFNRRVIVPALEVIQSCFGIVVIATVTDGVCLGYVLRIGRCGVFGYSAPGVVIVGRNELACGVINLNYVASPVADEVVIVYCAVMRYRFQTVIFICVAVADSLERIISLSIILSLWICKSYTITAIKVSINKKNKLLDTSADKIAQHVHKKRCDFLFSFAISITFAYPAGNL